MELVWAILGFLVGAALSAAAVYAACGRERTAAALARQQADAAAADRDAARDEAGHQRGRADHAERQAALAAQKVADAEARLAEQKALLDRAEERLKDAFRALSADSLARNNADFMRLAGEKFDGLKTAAAGDLDRRKTEIDGLLKPIRDVLDEHKRQLADAEKRREDDKLGIKEQLSAVAEAHRGLRDQTTQLVTMLARPDARGRWGELKLRRIVEMAGMTGHIDFDEQAQHRDDEGAAKRPDMTVHLPGKGRIFVDAKVPFDAFRDAADCDDDHRRQQLLAAHAAQMRQHVEALRRRNYWGDVADAAELVVMFVPAEALLYEAVAKAPDLIEWALDKQVIVATPTTLLGLLRTIEMGWRQQTLADNAKVIIKHGRDLHARLSTFAEHLDKVGRGLRGATTAYNDAVGSFDKRLRVTADRLADCGAAEKELPDVEPVALEIRTSQLLPADPNLIPPDAADNEARP